MSKPLNVVLRDMRAAINVERSEHQAIRTTDEAERLAGRTMARMPYALREAIRPFQRNLQTLVPLYRSLTALAQQEVDDSKSQMQYVKRYRALAAHIERFAGHIDHVQVLVRRHPQMSLLVPLEGLTPAVWPTKTLAELYAEALQAKESFVKRTKHTIATKGEFMDSLTAEQIHLLTEAMTAHAQNSNGVSGLHIFPWDVQAARATQVPA